MKPARPYLVGLLVGLAAAYVLMAWQVSASRAVTELAIAQMHDQQAALLQCQAPAASSKPRPRRMQVEL